MLPSVRGAAHSSDFHTETQNWWTSASTKSVLRLRNIKWIVQTSLLMAWHRGMVLKNGLAGCLLYCYFHHSNVEESITGVKDNQSLGPSHRSSFKAMYILNGIHTIAALLGYLPPSPCCYLEHRGIAGSPSEAAALWWICLRLCRTVCQVKDL